VTTPKAERAQRRAVVLDMVVRILSQHAKSGRVTCTPVNPDRLDWAIRTFEQFAPDPRKPEVTSHATKEQCHG